MTNNDLERNVLIEELSRRRPKSGNTGFSGIGLDPSVETPKVRSADFKDANFNGRDDRDEQPAAAAPAPTAEARPIVSRLNGYEDVKLNAEHAKKSPKYAFGLLAREFADTPEGLLEMSKDPRFAAAGFQYVGKDKIMAPDPNNGGKLALIDVGKGFSAGGGQGWQWGYEGAGSGAPAGGAAMAASPSSLGAISNLADSGLYSRLQEELAQILGGSAAVDRNALLQMLGGQR